MTQISNNLVAYSNYSNCIPRPAISRVAAFEKTGCIGSRLFSKDVGLILGPPVKKEALSLIEPLKESQVCMDYLNRILSEKRNGDFLTFSNKLDIICPPSW